MSSKILILGGGFAGLFAAREIKRRLGPSAKVELISERNYFVFQPLLPEVAGGSIAPLHAVSPLRVLLPDVFVREALVQSVDFENQVVTVFQGVQRRPTEVSYDQLVVAMGQVSDFSRMPGLTEHALPMKTLDDARRVRAHVIERLEHAEITSLPEVKREALTFCVVGAGFSGIETVGEIKDMIDATLKYYPNIRPEEVRVMVVEFADHVLGEMPKKLSDYAQKQLEKRGIEFKLQKGVASATGTRLILSDGEEIETRTIVATIGNAPSPVVTAMNLPKAQGRLDVERSLRVKGQRNVWSLGDCALIPMKDEAKDRADFAPPTAQFAVREARAIAANIETVLKGGEPKPFAYKSQGAMASLGARRGVAEVWGFQLKGFVAWLLWRAYYLMFLPGFGTRLRVGMNWLLDGLTPRSAVQVNSYTPSAARHLYFREGDRIFEAGTRADGVYTVVEGEVELTYPDTHTGEPVTTTLGPGQHFGERIVLGNNMRSGTVRALTNCKVLVLNRDEFLRIANAFPAMGTYFQAYMKDTYDIDWAPGGPDLGYRG